MKRQSPTRRRKSGGAKPWSCLALPAPVFTNRSNPFSSRKAVSRSIARMSARASVDQRMRSAIPLGVGSRHRLEIGHCQAEVGEDVFHGDGAVLVQRIEASP